MTHRSDRRLDGYSRETTGVVLDHASSNPRDPFVHCVMCTERKLYHMPYSVYDNYIQTMNKNKKNDILRMYEEALEFGHNIKFMYEVKDNIRVIQSFEKGGEIFIADCKDKINYFSSLSVFSPHLDMVYSERFGNVPITDLRKLEILPSPNVEILCSYRFKLVEKNGQLDDTEDVEFELAEIADNQEDIDLGHLALNADWNKDKMLSNAPKLNYGYGDDSTDEEPEYENKHDETYKKINDCVGIVTGLNTIYIPALPCDPVLFTTYKRFPNTYIGCRVTCNVVWSDVCHAYFAVRPKISTGTMFDTVIYQRPIIGCFSYFETFVRTGEELKNGFYDHPFFGLIYDPQNILDLHAQKYQPSRGRLVYKVIINDFFGLENEMRSARSMGRITRFDIVKFVGDDQVSDEIQKTKKLSPKYKKFFGTLINEKTGRFYSNLHPTCAFHVLNTHGHATGSYLEIEVTQRTKQDVIIKPYFEIHPEDYKYHGLNQDVTYRQDEKKFVFKAMYVKRHRCFKSDFFGYVPITHGTRDFNFDDLHTYTIKAEENTNANAQTVLCNAEVLNLDDY
ncbi:unnamed protein product [Bursaphelenchus okinawaensis]|uniref:Uncharacterized protein n=1 Tax=Bursaphelenchus okinawaensis TaxID=465554 RepID=A0A811K397_9BILA|nr:unnamed protein product [Bursaphelenchus okinawaensis]CAG9090451.1 unnamed protein product [Bursaphelenchus okinawaensis]